jgi:TetR/AcrR family transcriptional repressor of lmrAB and yxaGH operons
MIDAAITLMRGSGLTGAGINEIVRASGAPKGSVYHFFPDGKVQLATEALGVYSGRVLAFIDQTLSSRDEPRAKIEALFGAFAQRVKGGRFRQSCAVGTVSLDLDSELEALRVVLGDMLAEWQALIARHFAFDSARETRSFAGLIVTCIEGAYIRCRAEASSEPFVEAGRWLAQLVPAARKPVRSRQRSTR